MPRILCDLPLFLSSSCSLKRTLSLQREDFSRRVLSAKRWHRFPDCFDSLRSRSSCKKNPKKKKAPSAITNVCKFRVGSEISLSHTCTRFDIISRSISVYLSSAKMILSLAPICTLYDCVKMIGWCARVARLDLSFSPSLFFFFFRTSLLFFCYVFLNAPVISHRLKKSQQYDTSFAYLIRSNNKTVKELKRPRFFCSIFCFVFFFLNARREKQPQGSAKMNLLAFEFTLNSKKKIKNSLPLSFIILNYFSSQSPFLIKFIYSTAHT